MRLRFLFFVLFILPLFFLCKSVSADSRTISFVNQCNYPVWFGFAGGSADLQALSWERDPQRMIQAPETVSASQVQDVARTYF